MPCTRAVLLSSVVTQSWEFWFVSMPQFLLQYSLSFRMFLLGAICFCINIMSYSYRRIKPVGAPEFLCWRLLRDGAGPDCMACKEVGRRGGFSLPPPYGNRSAPSLSPHHVRSAMGSGLLVMNCCGNFTQELGLGAGLGVERELCFLDVNE